MEIKSIRVANGDEYEKITINGKVEYAKDGKVVDRFAMLAEAARQDNKQGAWEIMNTASMLYSPLGDEVFNILYGSVAMDITWQYDIERNARERRGNK